MQRRAPPYLPRRVEMRPIRWVERELWPPRGGPAVQAVVPVYPAPEAVHVRMLADLPKLERDVERERASELRRKARKLEASTAGRG